MHRFAIWLIVPFGFAITLHTDPAAADESTSANDGDAKIVSAGLAAPNIVALTIDEGVSELGSFEAYEKQSGDAINEAPRRSTLRRGGKVIGFVSGTPDSPQRFVRMNDRFRGRRADRDTLMDPASWTVRTSDAAIAVESVSRKSRVLDIAEYAEGRPDVCFRHEIYLRIKPLDGQTIERIESADPVIKPWTRLIKSVKGLVTTRSPAVHVSQIGFRPSDPAKFAILSCWMGDGGGVDYAAELGGPPKFVLINGDGKIAHQGTGTLRQKCGEPADYRGVRKTADGVPFNYAGADAYTLDFSTVDAAGTYRVYVQGIGCSHEFKIDDAVYRRLSDIAVEGLAAHRWGETRTLRLIDGKTMPRPAAVPATNDGQSPEIFDSGAAYTNANFDEIVAGAGDVVRFDDDRGVIGGYMDAGDYDRNFNHHNITYYLADLSRRVRPHDAERADALLEAARWNLDVFVRLQSDDGGVTSAIEYREHPRSGEPSWLNSLPMYVCAPHFESNAKFTLAAAKLAAVMNDIDPAAATRYADAATRGAAWTRQNSDAVATRGFGEVDDWLLAIDVELAVARRKLGRSDDGEFNNLVKRLDAEFPDPWSGVSNEVLPAIHTVLETDAAQLPLGGERRQRLAAAAMRTVKSVYIDGSVSKSPYGLLKHGYVPVTYGGGTYPNALTMEVSRSAALSGDADIWSGVVSGVAYGSGCNPHNIVFMTGVNKNSLRQSLHCDTRATGHRSPIGIPIYGPCDTSGRQGAWPLNWHLHGDQTIYPEYATWPALENVQEFWSWGMQMEYTVHQLNVAVIYHTTMLDLPR